MRVALPPSTRTSKGKVWSSCFNTRRRRRHGCPKEYVHGGKGSVVVLRLKAPLYLSLISQFSVRLQLEEQQARPSNEDPCVSAKEISQRHSDLVSLLKKVISTPKRKRTHTTAFRIPVSHFHLVVSFRDIVVFSAVIALQRRRHLRKSLLQRAATQMAWIWKVSKIVTENSRRKLRLRRVTIPKTTVNSSTRSLRAFIDAVLDWHGPQLHAPLV